MLALDHTVAASEPISHTLHVLAVELAMHERGGRRHAMNDAYSCTADLIGCTVAYVQGFTQDLHRVAGIYTVHMRHVGVFSMHSSKYLIEWTKV